MATFTRWVDRLVSKAKERYVYNKDNDFPYPLPVLTITKQKLKQFWILESNFAPSTRMPFEIYDFIQKEDLRYVVIQSPQRITKSKLGVVLLTEITDLIYLQKQCSALGKDFYRFAPQSRDNTVVTLNNKYANIYKDNFANSKLSFLWNKHWDKYDA